MWCEKDTDLTVQSLADTMLEKKLCVVGRCDVPKGP